MSSTSVVIASATLKEMEFKELCVLGLKEEEKHDNKDIQVIGGIKLPVKEYFFP